jgi:uncharacterized RDD family membrane protein YckC
MLFLAALCQNDPSSYGIIFIMLLAGLMYLVIGMCGLFRKQDVPIIKKDGEEENVILLSLGYYLELMQKKLNPDSIIEFILMKIGKSYHIAYLFKYQLFISNRQFKDWHLVDRQEVELKKDSSAVTVYLRRDKQLEIQYRGSGYILHVSPKDYEKLIAWYKRKQNGRVYSYDIEEEQIEKIINKKKSLFDPTPRSRRFANFLLDTIFYIAIALLAGLSLDAIAALFGISDSVIVTLGNIIVLSLYPLYYMILEAFLGKTFAKFITKTKVINKDGSKPIFITIFWRTLARLIPFEPLSFFTKDGWHDSLSKTTVIDDR